MSKLRHAEDCGGSNENFHTSNLMDFITRPQLWCCLGMSSRCGQVGGSKPMKVGDETLKTHVVAHCIPLFWLVQDVSSLGWLLQPPYPLPATMASLASLWICKSKHTTSSTVALVTVFYHSTEKELMKNFESGVGRHSSQLDHIVFRRNIKRVWILYKKCV